MRATARDRVLDDPSGPVRSVIVGIVDDVAYA